MKNWVCRVFAGLFRRPWGPLNLLVVACAWLATVCNAPLWRELGRLGLLGDAQGWLFALAFAGIIFCALVFCCAGLAWRPLIKPLVTILLLMAALGAYAMWQYGVVLDPSMLTNALQTDAREVRDLLSVKLLGFVVVLAGLPVWWLWHQPLAPAAGWLRTLGKNMLACALALLLLLALLWAVFRPFASLMRNEMQVRYLINPLNSMWSLGVVVAKPFQKPKTLEPIGLDAKWTGQANARPKLLIVVLGETGRAGNFQLNGYARATNPLLSQRHRVVSFNQVQSCGTSTAASVPCMFAPQGRLAFDHDGNQESLLDVLQRAGLAVLWVDNQSGCKGVCDRVPTVETTLEKDKAYCSTGECFDAIMLAHLDAQIAQLPPERRARGVVVVLHQMGSHGPDYYKRSPASVKRFASECRSNDLPSCSRQNIINAYDNSIVYTDFLLDQTITWLQAREKNYRVSMLYMADHGESLGEDNIYLHGLPYAIAPEVQKHVPWIAWFGPDFGEDVDCLAARKAQPLSHDNLFHTVMGMMQVSSSVYRPDWDAYLACRR